LVLRTIHWVNVWWKSQLAIY